MLEKLHEGDSVVITLRDKSTIDDVVVSIDRDGTTKFKELGYRYRSGMEFHDHPSKKDIVAITIGARESVIHDDMPMTDDALVKECNRLSAENAELKEKIKSLECEIDALKAAKTSECSEMEPEKPASKRGRKPAAKKDEGKKDADNTPESASDSEETGTADAE